MEDCACSSVKELGVPGRCLRTHAHCCVAGTCGIKSPLTTRPPSSQAALDLPPNSELVASIRDGEFKLCEGFKDKALFASGVALETPRLPTPPRANVSHADPPFETDCNF